MTTTVAKPAWLESHYGLASRAECATPDSEESAGAQLLLGVAADAWERCESNAGAIDEDAIHEIADAAPNVYTHQRWQEFVDLCAYQENLSEFGGCGDDLTNAAGVALYMIAERLARAVVEAYAEALDGTAEDE